MTRRSDGFSLVEVVVAVGVFVAGVVGAIALLSTSTQSASATLDANGAIRVAESASVLVHRQPWEDIVSRLNASEDAPVEPIYATRDGSKISRLSDGTVDLGDAYYEIKLARLTALSPADNDETAGFLAFAIEVSWPVRDENDGVLAASERESFTINTAIHR